MSAGLGSKPIAEDRYGADLELLDRFVGFSGELVRISLLGIAAIGFFIEKLMPEDRIAASSVTWMGRLLSWAAALFGLAVTFGLLHRYYATDGVAFHIAWLRYKLEGRPRDEIAAEAEGRARSYKRAEGWLVTSACAAAAGVIVLGITFLIRFAVSQGERPTMALAAAVVATALAAIVAAGSWWRVLGSRSGLGHHTRAEA